MGTIFSYSAMAKGGSDEELSICQCVFLQFEIKGYTKFVNTCIQPKKLLRSYHSDDTMMLVVMIMTMTKTMTMIMMMMMIMTLIVIVIVIMIMTIIMTKIKVEAPLSTLRW